MIVVLNSKPLDVIALPLVSLFFKRNSQVSTIPLCSSAKSLLYRVLPSVCVRCWSLFGISFQLLHVLRTVRYTIRCVCFCKQLCSIDRLIDRSVFGFGAYHLRSHRHFCSHSTSRIISVCFVVVAVVLFSFGWKWEIIFIHDLEFFHNGMVISIWKKLLCSDAYVSLRVCVYFIASWSSNTLCTFEFVSCCVLIFRFAWK